MSSSYWNSIEKRIPIMERKLERLRRKAKDHYEIARKFTYEANKIDMELKLARGMERPPPMEDKNPV